MLHIFHQSVVESEISSAVSCWSSSIRVSDLKKLDKLIQKAGSVLEPLNLHEIKIIMVNPEHPLHNTVIQQQYLQSEASSDPLQYWLQQEVFPAHS